MLKRPAGNSILCRPNFTCIMLDPSRSRIALPELLLRKGSHLTRSIK